MFRSLIICFTCCQFAFSVPASGRQQQKRKPRPRAHPGTHARAHDVYNVGNIQLMLTSVVIAMGVASFVTCTHHAHTLAHPHPRAEERGRKKGEGVEELPCTHTHARTIAPEPPKGGGNISIYIYRPTQAQPDPKAFCINIHCLLHKYTRN